MYTMKLTSSSPSQSSTTDMDTSPKKRGETPDFYGFVPPTGRGLIFVLMVVNSTSQFLARITAIALLGAVSKTWVVAYLVGDMCLFLLYKLLRNDLIYFIPFQSYAGSIVFSLLGRILIKVRVFGDGLDDLRSFHPTQSNDTHPISADRRRLYGFDTG